MSVADASEAGPPPPHDPEGATPARRLGPESSQIRMRFIDAAEAILGEDGEKAISARTVAARAGLKTQLLYYYFRTMDDVLLAVVQRVNERRLARFAEALASPQPLRALWAQMSDPASAALAAEMTGIARHREAVRAEINAAAQHFRALQSAAVARLLPPPEPGGIQYTAAGVVMIAAALARMLVNERSLGLTESHGEALAIVEQLLPRLAGEPQAEPVKADADDPGPAL